MKNFFGLVPGNVYGWPKNKLHHIGIPRSIVELNRVFRRTFAIVDGIVGMEGNGPIQGKPKPAASSSWDPTSSPSTPPAAASWASIPTKSNTSPWPPVSVTPTPPGVHQRAERPETLRTDFDLVDSFRHLRL